MPVKPARLLTLPNAVSTAGLLLVMHGAISLDTPLGLAEVVAGRTLDVLDGHIARKTGQSSSFGAALDAVFDKIAVAVIIIGAWHYGLAPTAVLAMIVTLNAVNAAATITARRRHAGQELHSSHTGKYAMAMQNITLFLYAARGLPGEDGQTLSNIIATLGHASAAVGIALGAAAALEYLRRARK